MLFFQLGDAEYTGESFVENLPFTVLFWNWLIADGMDETFLENSGINVSLLNWLENINFITHNLEIE